MICENSVRSQHPVAGLECTHRYIGDFIIENGTCLSYDEPGKTSGFVNSGTLAVPWIATGITATSEDRLTTSQAHSSGAHLL